MRLTYACIFMLSSLIMRFFVRGSLEVSGTVSMLASSQAASVSAKGISSLRLR
ncbi:hypothetical protein PHMEG_00026330 [Phytophthora megakarya]|uniref:RxLR effector protein n=1 Tax=Phytophthora megakarya TaxID=4795 RepID=A0A225VAM7_9STRA|nr:hypothetical protein PHMEG_00026330 [Phytophthora megakarya]